MWLPNEIMRVHVPHPTSAPLITLGPCNSSAA